MHKKKNQSSCLLGIMFLLVFFFSLNAFSAKLIPEQEKEKATEKISLSALLQTDAVQPQPLVKLDIPAVEPSVLFFFSVSPIPAQKTSSTIVSSNEGPDPFCRFFYFHHAAYGEEPYRAA